MDVAPRCYKWDKIGWMDGWLDGSLGGVRCRAPYGANNIIELHEQYSLIS